jgi:hypothetical protein
MIARGILHPRELFAYPATDGIIGRQIREGLWQQPDRAIDWDISQADDLREGGASWRSRRMGDCGQAARNDLNAAVGFYTIDVGEPHRSRSRNGSTTVACTHFVA